MRGCGQQTTFHAAGREIGPRVGKYRASVTVRSTPPSPRTTLIRPWGRQRGRRRRSGIWKTTASCTLLLQRRAAVLLYDIQVHKKLPCFSLVSPPPPRLLELPCNDFPLHFLEQNAQTTAAACLQILVGLLPHGFREQEDST